MDLEALYRMLERATFSQREQIADEVVRETPPGELGALVRGLEHPHQAVRLGVIEILRRANHRVGLRKLLEHARKRGGDDRVFALRAMADLARPEDDFLADAVQGWLASGDPFVEAHAARLASILTPPRARGLASGRAPGPPASEPGREAPPVESLDRLVVRLFSAEKGSERIALLEAIEARGPQALFAAAKLTLQKGSADLVALVCRAVIRQVSALPGPERLLPMLEAARARVGGTPITSAAIDDALLALGGLALSPALLSRLGELDEHQQDAVVRRLCELPPSEAALHAPAMLDALDGKPALWSSLGPALAHAAPHTREGARRKLRELTDLMLEDLRKRKQPPAVAITSACRVLAATAERGEPLPGHLRIALDRIAGAEAARALCALCARLATEEAAVLLIAMLRDPVPEARDAAREALQAWQSPWIQIEGAGEPAIVHRYEDAKGQPLARRGDRLVAAGGEEHVLDARGRPIRSDATELGGCLCCAPPRALVRRRKEGLRCPGSWESHLRDGERTMFERDHELGRCRRCDSGRPRVRDGSRVICMDCGAGRPSGDGFVQPPQEEPMVPSEHGRADRHALPKPPPREELEHIAPHIRTAIMANVFLDARAGDDRWNGSGIIIACDGGHIAILTNRHVVEHDDPRRRCAVKALTVSGEAIAVRAVWCAKRGVDLAVVEGRLEHPESVGVMALGDGAVLVGAEVFAIGNPLGLAWSYIAGTLSAIRHWTTPEGQSVRILQTDANIAPGSSGGGLFHREGHLVGVVSFLRQGYAGGSAHFALSIAAIREALARDDVRWRGRALADPPP